MTESTDVNLRLAQAIEWDMNVRDWEHSFDACLRDIVPVLRARGLYWHCGTAWDDGKFWVAIQRGMEPISRVRDGESLPAAFCEAALKALEATK